MGSSAIARHVYAKHCQRSGRTKHYAARRDEARRPLGEDDPEQLLERIDVNEQLASCSPCSQQCPRPASARPSSLWTSPASRPQQAAAALGVSPGTLCVRLVPGSSQAQKGDQTQCLQSSRTDFGQN